jgi:drug/metabolite transporter (DMT)-like permease
VLASGAVGVGAADLCFFRGLVLIGPRLGMLILSLGPFLAAGIAYFTPLRERLGAWAGVGIALSVAGVAWVVAERRGRHAWRGEPGGHAAGLAWCAAGMALMQVSFVLQKLGLAGGTIHPFSVALVRVVAGAAVILPAVAAMGRLRRTAAACLDRRAMAVILPGTLVGPVLGIWMAAVAVAGTETAVAVALIGTSPVLMIPIAYFGYRERPTARTLAGTVLAVAGVAVLILRPR